MEPVLELTVPFVEGAAAIVFVFSFFGFFASRFPRCSPLAISASPRVGRSVTPAEGERNIEVPLKLLSFGMDLRVAAFSRLDPYSG